MRTCLELQRLSDRDLMCGLTTRIARECDSTAEVVAYIAEVDARRLYAPAGYPSMYAFCVRQLGLSEDAAMKRIQAARAARRFPAIFPALADGQLHLSAVCLLAPHLTTGNAEGLVAAAARKTKSEIELLLAQRFPRTELLPMVTVRPTAQPAPGQVAVPALAREMAPPAQPAPGQVEAGLPRSRVKPIAPQRFELHCTIDQRTHDLLRYAQELLSHQVAQGDVAQVLQRALEALVPQLEKRKFAATEQPRRSQRRSESPRTIPARVKRAVWARDRGQCTFVSETGHRCQARSLLEYDHVDPVARGGQATVKGVRLRCRTHNQLEAERVFGAGFMEGKRGASRLEKEREPAAAADPDLLACLRTLGYRADESRRAAALCESIPDASLEDRVRLALSYFRPRIYSRKPALQFSGAS